MVNTDNAEKPMSYQEFLKRTGLEDSKDSVAAHSESLLHYRMARAAELGISLDELHDRHDSQETKKSV